VPRTPDGDRPVQIIRRTLRRRLDESVAADLTSDILIALKQSGYRIAASRPGASPEATEVLAKSISQYDSSAVCPTCQCE
jgi:hypothetical protein